MKNRKISGFVLIVIFDFDVTKVHEARARGVLGACR